MTLINRQESPKQTAAFLPPKDPYIELVDVSLQFDKSQHAAEPKTVLENVSMSVGAGEFLALVGRSGCGKTTILNLIAGLLNPTSGTLRVGEQDSGRDRDVSYMFARDALLPWRTAKRNVELFLELRAMGESERRNRSAALLKSLGLSEAADQYPWQLSQGMRQRVALARTWALEPRVVLMDEPFAALDAQTRTTVQREFLETWQEKKPSVVFVTHDISEAILLADRVLVVNHGAISREIVVPFKRPRDLAHLVGDPAFNELRLAVSDAIQ